jgi:hypothetical protein
MSPWPQIFWREISLPISYTMMCVGYSFYLSVGFNHVMGMTLRMRQVSRQGAQQCVG